MNEAAIEHFCYSNYWSTLWNEVDQRFNEWIYGDRVVSVSHKEKVKQRPVALNTVELMRVASSGLSNFNHLIFSIEIHFPSLLCLIFFFCNWLSIIGFSWWFLLIINVLWLLIRLKFSANWIHFCFVLFSISPIWHQSRTTKVLPLDLFVCLFYRSVMDSFLNDRYEPPSRHANSRASLHSGWFLIEFFALKCRLVDT